MNSQTKVMSFETTRQWLTGARRQGRRVVCTNGCFDILHSGHVTYLEGARSLGDLLMVGLNSDSSVRALKGPDRPVNGEQDRARVLAALGCVDAVCIFAGKRADRFLELVSPDVYVKGGDYTLGTLDPGERSVPPVRKPHSRGHDGAQRDHDAHLKNGELPVHSSACP